MKKINILLVLLILLVSMIPANAAPEGDESKLKIAYVSSRGGDIQIMADASENETVKELVVVDGIGATTYNENLADTDLSSYDIIILHDLSSQPVIVLEQTIRDAIGNGAKVIVAGQDVLANQLKTTITNENHNAITDYLGFISAEGNAANLLLYLAKMEGKYEEKVPAASKPNVYGIYHPDREEREFFNNASEYLEWYADDTRGEGLHVYDPAKPTIGIMPSSNLSRMNRDQPIIDYFVRAVENEGYNVLVGTYVYKAMADKGDPDANRNNYIICDENGNEEVVVDVIISLSRGGRFFSTSTDEGVAELENLGVTVLTAVQLYENKTKEEWEESDYGVFPTQHYQLAFAEQDGMIEPIVVAAKPKDANGITIDRNDPIDYQADWMVQRAIGWADLATMENKNKKIVIPYYAAEAGKSNIGSDPDYYLNAPESILNILKAMKNAGYDIGDDELPTNEELVEQMVESGYNIGTWAPGQLEKMAESENAILYPVDEYMKYYNTLDESKRQEIEKIWGEAPGDIMVYQKGGKDYFVIPSIEFGNILLTPTPLRGRDQNEIAMANEKNYPPTHQALAVYHYINSEETDSGYGADALLPLWSNLATMSGKQSGLSANDWTALMIQDLPNIHILPMDATGITDKRRANMRIITFMTPTLVPGELYGDLTKLDVEIKNYESLTDEGVKAESFSLILEYCNDAGLSTSLDIDWEAIKEDDVEIKKAVDKLKKHLSEIKSSMIPYGDHIFGVAPEGDELVAMIGSMMTYNTAIDDILRSAYSDEAVMEEIKYELIKSVVIDGKSVSDAVTAVTGSSNSGLENALKTAIDYQIAIEGCDNEIQGLLDALDGKYIPVATTGDPIQNPEALPTGKNPVQADSRTVPTEAAYRVGKALGDNLIAEYQKKNSGYPEKVAFLLWAVETARNGGTSESEIFYLMGVEPVWNSTNGRITGLRLIENWNQPRVDIVVETSGSYRDVYSRQIIWINEAVRLAAEAEDNGKPNYVKEHSDEIFEALKKENSKKPPEEQMSEEYLRDLSYARVFGPPLGEYTPGIENVAGSGLEDSTDIAGLYIDRMSNVYGVSVTVDGEKVTLWGEAMPDLLKNNLKDVEMGVFSRSSNVYGVLDHPMVASYFGGLALAIKESGGTAEMYINNQRNGETDVQTLSEFLSADLNSRYLNPKWIEGMMNSGYAGAAHMNELFETLGVWQMTMPDLVTGQMWNSLYETYMNDKHDTGVTEFLKDTNPYAYQSMVANALQSIYNGDWNASDEIRQQLEKEYIEQTVLNGVVCCHHTCSNMKFNEQIINGMTSIQFEENDKQLKQQFLDELNVALDKQFKMPKTKTSSGSGTGGGVIVNSTSDDLDGTIPIQTEDAAGSGFGEQPTPAGSTQVSGYEMITQKAESAVSDIKDFIANPTVSSSSIIAIAFVVLAVGAIFFGFRRKGI